MDRFKRCNRGHSYPAEWPYCGDCHQIRLEEVVDGTDEFELTERMQRFYAVSQYHPTNAPDPTLDPKLLEGLLIGGHRLAQEAAILQQHQAQKHIDHLRVLAKLGRYRALDVLEAEEGTQ